MLIHTKDRRHDRLDETHDRIDRIEDRFVSLENRVIEIDRKLTALIAHLNATDEVDNTGQYTLYLRIRYPPGLPTAALVRRTLWTGSEP